MSKPTSLEQWYDGFPHMADQIKEMRGALLERDATITRLEAAIVQARRDVLNESRDAAHDAIHDAINELNECQRVQQAVDAAIAALASPRAAHEQSEAGNG